MGRRLRATEAARSRVRHAVAKSDNQRRAECHADFHRGAHIKTERIRLTDREQLMQTGQVNANQVVRNTSDGLPVTGSMARFRAAAPFLRALILVGIVIVLIMFGLPKVLAFAAAAPL